MNKQRIKTVERGLSKIKEMEEMKVIFRPLQSPAGVTSNTSGETKNNNPDIPETKSIAEETKDNE